MSQATDSSPDGALGQIAEAIAEALRTELARTERLPQKLLFTTAEAAALTGLPESWFEQNAAAGRIPSRKPGGGKYRRYSLADLEEIVEAAEVAPTSGPLAKRRREQTKATAVAVR